MNLFNTELFDNIISLVERLYYFFIAVILIIGCYNIFYNLGNIPINSWDEARHGVNAYEMLRRKNYVVNTYAYNTDYWNLKPPLSYLTIILGYKLVGFNPLGLRIFSGIAAILTIIFITLFVLYKYGRLSSLISAAVLTTTVPFVTEHCARTGDADSIYVLFFTTAIISLAMIEKNSKWILCCGLSFAMAFLSKSWHAGNIIVIAFVYMLLTGVLFKLKIKDLVLIILSSVIPIGIWAIFRYANDGVRFFKHMIEYDLMARTSRCLEGHVGGVYYYLESMQWSYFYWTIAFFGTTIAALAFLYKAFCNKRLINDGIIVGAWILIPFVLYTVAKTKISWYILPMYPAMAVSIGALSNFLLKNEHRNIILQAFLCIIIVSALYKNEEIIVKRISTFKTDYAQELIKEMRNFPEYKGKKIYIHHFEQSYWLSAELYDDLVPVQGGVQGFIKDNSEKTLLFITKENLKLIEAEKNKLKILLQNKDAYIFVKYH